MHHKTTVENIVRGDTGLERTAIVRRLDGMKEGESVAFRRYQMLGGGDVTVTRRGTQFEVSGHTTL